MNRPSLIDTTLKRISAARWQTRARKPGAAAGYLYVSCAPDRSHGHTAEPRRRVQAVPIVRRTAKWIYYDSDTWDRSHPTVSPGRISREQLETDTRCHDPWLAGTRDHHGYPAGVIPVPGDSLLPGPAGRLFFATREAAEADLYRREHDRAEQAARQAPPIKELRRAMADAHPDRGGNVEQFIQARRRYQTGLRTAPR